MRRSPMREARLAVARRAEQHDITIQYRAVVLLEMANLLLEELLRGMTPANRALIARGLDPALGTLEERVTKLRSYARLDRA
jgi:hypothetical protein